MKKALSLVFVFVLLLGMVSIKIFAIDNDINPWENRSAVFVGDSITAGSGTTKIYFEYLAERLGLSSVTPMGVGGSCISAASNYGQSNQPLINRYQNIPSADLIVVFMGTNDYGHETPLGSVNDTQDGTFYGALNTIVPELVSNHTSSKVVFVTPLHRYGFGTSNILGTKYTYDSVPNGVGATLGDYAEAITTVCANNDVPVIDLYAEYILDPSDAVIRTEYMPDGLHPNAVGHEVIAGIMESHIRRLDPVKQEPVVLTEIVFGNRFAPGNNQTCRASSRINYYLKAGTIITLKDPSAMQWACTKTSDETSFSNLGYFPDSAWSDKETAVVAADGWVGFVFKYRDETRAFDLTKPLSDYIIIEKPHTHTYENGICTVCGAEHPNLANYEGKVISILGDSISTFAGYIPIADGFNLQHRPRYPQSNLFSDVNLTWWMQTITALDAKLGINDSWAGSTVTNTITGNSGDLGEKAAMASLTRIQNLGANGTPDVILLYGGTNDIGRLLPLGSFDPATAPTEVDLTTTKWTTVADAYVNAIMRLQYYYPEAEILVMLPTYTASYYTNAKLAQYNTVFSAICEHYGIPYIDLRDCGISTANLPDGIHPDATGMDYITRAVLDTLLNDMKMEAGEHIVHSVTHNLNGAESSLGYYKGITHGKSFVTTITGENVTVSVTMGGADITDTAYANGVVTIAAVTGDLVITTQGRVKPIYEDHLQQLPENLCCSTNLWSSLVPENTYYTGSAWGNVSGNSVYSITIPVAAGDQIWATSFQKSGTNGGSRNGIRVTWFSVNGVLKTTDPVGTYAEFTANGGYLVAPEGAVAINIPMWGDKDSYEIYILNCEHTYTPTITAPTCTEQGYITYTCECGDSYTSDVVAALGHDFSQSFVCSRCDHVAKVSVLGDSISTYAGFSAVKNAVYPNKTIQSVEDTWWKQVVDTMGAQLLVNNASGGSRVLSDEYFNGNGIREGNYAAYRDRCVNLHDGDEKPDVIFVFMGTNDFSYHVDSSCEKCQILLNCSECTAREDGNLNVCSKCRSISGIYSSFCNLPLGIADSVNASAEVPTSVCEAYAIMLSKMKAAYPNAQIYCMGLLPRVNPYQNATYHDHGHPTAFNAELKKVAENAGARFISLEQSVDNSVSTWNTYFGDAVHPTAIGMDKISAAVLTDVLGKEITLASYAAPSIAQDSPVIVTALLTI